VPVPRDAADLLQVLELLAQALAVGHRLLLAVAEPTFAYQVVY
jgi:hypothetical protein